MQFGDYRVEIIPDTEFRLDGGAMFGVVPRVVWERVSPPDDKNRIRMNMNCVFIDTGKDKILIETGIGEKWSPKHIEMYGIFRARPLAETLFERTGCRPEDITVVVNTHLHFDHAGGNTIGTDAASQFPNARYLVSSSELKHAEKPHERDRASYLSENWRPVSDSGQLEEMPSDYEVVPGLSMQTIRGHSDTMQTWRLDRGGDTLYGFADLIPTRHHVPLPWIMGYDLYPTETLAFKKEVLPQAMNENWLCLFYHDLDTPVSTIQTRDGKLVAVPVSTSAP
jgi:glyoxylase-like metal-dependent hydrolase (beta-lactamase superfamily II)